MGAPDGRFEIDGLSEGIYRIVARRRVSYPAEEHLDATIKTGWWLAITEIHVQSQGPLDLTLSPWESVHGRVAVLDGRGLGEFYVHAMPLNVPSEFDDLIAHFHHEWGFQSPDGTFELVGLFPGEWGIWASDGDYAIPVQRRIMLPHKDPVDFELVRNVELNGRIVDSAGENLRGTARVTWAEAGASIAAGEDDEDTWGNGLFRLHAPPAMVELRATYEGRHSEPIPLDLTMGRSRDNLLLVVPSKE